VGIVLAAFGPMEYVALMVFAFACLTGLLADQPVKALLATGIGLAMVEAANNSASNSNFAPMLTLGIPSSGTTAIMLGVLTLYNLTPGSTLFTAQPDLVWGLIASLFIGNVMLLAMNIPLGGVFARMLSVPAWVLVPFIVLVSAVRVHSDKSAIFDRILMVAVEGCGGCRCRWDC